MATRAFFKQLVNASRNEAHIVAKQLRKQYLDESKRHTRYNLRKCTGGYKLYFYNSDPPKVRADKGKKREKPRKQHKEYKRRVKTVRPKIGKYEHSEEFKNKQADPNKPKSNAGRKPKYAIKQKMDIDDLLYIIKKTNGIDITKEELMSNLKDYAMAKSGIDRKLKDSVIIDTNSIELCTPINHHSDLADLQFIPKKK